MIGRTVSIGIVLLLAVELVGASRQAPRSTTVEPVASWAKSYFQTIDRLAQRMKLTPLRSLTLGPGDLEVRIWEGFGIGGLRGFAAKRVGQKWSTVAIVERPHQQAAFTVVPKSTDWAGTWARLEQDGISEIPDDPKGPTCLLVMDGVAYVVEIATEGFYRTFHVNNPEIQRSEDGDRFLRLLATLYPAFGALPPVDVSKLPRGAVQVVSSVSSVRPPTTAEQPSGWSTAGGEVRERLPDIQMPSPEALAQGIELTTPRCQEGLPPIAAQSRVTGDVAVELRIEPNGTVSAARSLSGSALLRGPSVEAALRWKFVPMASGNQARRTVLTVTYKQEWTPFPWLK